MSSSQHPPEHKLELESQFILRLPEAQADALRQAIKTGEPLAKRLSIRFDNDIRHGNIKFDNWTLAARLYDLPTIIESYKTLDRKNFYKTADISQILICKEDPGGGSCSTGNNNGENDEESRKAYYDNLFSEIGSAGKRENLFPHGVTPPLKNVRKRRFRKTLKKKYVDFSEIEKEVKRLFKFDCEAIESRYEIVEESKLDKIQPTPFSVDHNNPSPLSGVPMGMQSAENSQNIDVHELFGEECSSSDESDDDDDDDDEIEAENDNMMEDDNMDDDEEMEEVSNQLAPPAAEASVPAADIAAEIAAASDLISQNDDTEEKRQELNKELASIRERIQNQENQLVGLENPNVRNIFQSVLDNLQKQEEEIKRQLEELTYM